MGTPQVAKPVSNPLSPPSSGFGGDLLGFGSISNPPPQVLPQPTNNSGFGGDLMGFGVPSPQPVPQQTNVGFNFGITSTPVVTQPQPPQPSQPQPQPQPQNIGFDLFGNNSQPVSQPTLTSNPNSANTGFKPIINTNPNKFLAY